jgi:hypothetical protein
LSSTPGVLKRVHVNSTSGVFFPFVDDDTDTDDADADTDADTDADADAATSAVAIVAFTDITAVVTTHKGVLQVLVQKRQQ